MLQKEVGNCCSLVLYKMFVRNRTSKIVERETERERKEVRKGRETAAMF